MYQAQNALRTLSLVALPLALGCGASPAREGAASPSSGDQQTTSTSSAADDGAPLAATSPTSEPDESEKADASPHEGPPAKIDERSEAPLPEGTKVLHVGDSFAGALGLPLGELFETAGLRSVLKHTDSSYLTDWAWDGNLQKYLWKYNPDLVIVTLGANELEIAQPEQREKTVKKIIATIGQRPCVWVAIPLWDGPKNGLLDVIEEHSGPCVYMDTNALFDPSKMDRIQDGIHPTTAARKEWAADVLEWLKEHRQPTAEQPWHLKE